MEGDGRRPPLSEILPPLIFGSAQISGQYNRDPYALGTSGLVRRALELGIRAFDTSPYYGPSEELLGQALGQADIVARYPRSSYQLLTKVGRVGQRQFDYSAEWIRESVQRSLKRLGTDYLDVVYCHDVEFVSGDEVVAAIQTLRRLREQEGWVRYVGISGYPLPVLCELASRVQRETGQGLDVVQSYGHCTLQNELLVTYGAGGMHDAGVDVVSNASPLAMGLLRAAGVPVGAHGDFHPAPSALRQAAAQAAAYTRSHGWPLETVALHFALEEWSRRGADVGSRGRPPASTAADKVGVSVIGVSTVQELEATLEIWRGVTGKSDIADKISSSGRQAIRDLYSGARQTFGDWQDYSWPSPPAGPVERT